MTITSKLHLYTINPSPKSRKVFHTSNKFLLPENMPLRPHTIGIFYLSNTEYSSHTDIPDNIKTQEFLAIRCITRKKTRFTHYATIDFNQPKEEVFLLLTKSNGIQPKPSRLTNNDLFNTFLFLNEEAKNVQKKLELLLK
jgi:hypothetical protein